MTEKQCPRHPEALMGGVECPECVSEVEAFEQECENAFQECMNAFKGLVLPGMHAVMERRTQEVRKPMARLREYLGKLCDESSSALEKAAHGNDQNYWGGRLRLLQEIIQKIEAGDFLKEDKPPETKEQARKSCNRHSDCERADNEYRKKHGEDPGVTFHCHDDECEDCFGK